MGRSSRRKAWSGFSFSLIGCYIKVKKFSLLYYLAITGGGIVGYTFPKCIVLCWIPSHIEIQENKKTNSAAKSAPKMHVDNTFRIPYTDWKIRMYKKWQLCWSNNNPNKLLSLGDWRLGYKEEVALSLNSILAAMVLCISSAILSNAFYDWMCGFWLYMIKIV